MDSDQGKLFIGGISWETSEEKLKEYFEKYGEVLQTVIMKEKITGKPRGFGFVAFSDPSVLDRVLQEKHNIDGRSVEAKRAMSREEQQQNPSRSNVGRSAPTGGGTNQRTKKIFVGGLPPTLSEEGFRQYFQAYGNVTDVVVMYDQSTQRPRGFGFISFDTEDAVDRVLHKTFHELSGKMVEVKRAMPKDSNAGSGGGGRSGYTSSYDGRGDSNRGYMNQQQQQQAEGGYSAYGSGGYAAQGYGYGAAGNAAGYGGYNVGGYGSAPNPAAYGNPNAAAAAGYGGGPPGAPRSPWNNQTPAGYGGNAGYGAAATTWNAQAGSGAAGPTGQSPGAAAGYGNQGYGYGGYQDGAYGSQGGYGAVGGRGGGAPAAAGAGEQGAGAGGYMGGGGYGDGSGNAGYPNTWRSDPSQGGGAYGGAPAGAAGYGGGYGGASRQAQQQ